MCVRREKFTQSALQAIEKEKTDDFKFRCSFYIQKLRNDSVDIAVKKSTEERASADKTPTKKSTTATKPSAIDGLLFQYNKLLEHHQQTLREEAAAKVEQKAVEAAQKKTKIEEAVDKKTTSSSKKIVTEIPVKKTIVVRQHNKSTSESDLKKGGNASSKQQKVHDDTDVNSNRKSNLPLPSPVDNNNNMGYPQIYQGYQQNPMFNMFNGYIGNSFYGRGGYPSQNQPFFNSFIGQKQNPYPVDKDVGFSGSLTGLTRNKVPSLSSSKGNKAAAKNVKPVVNLDKSGTKGGASANFKKLLKPSPKKKVADSRLIGPKKPINMHDFQNTHNHREPSLNLDGLVHSVKLPATRSKIDDPSNHTTDRITKNTTTSKLRPTSVPPSNSSEGRNIFFNIDESASTQRTEQSLPPGEHNNTFVASKIDENLEGKTTANTTTDNSTLNNSTVALINNTITDSTHLRKANSTNTPENGTMDSSTGLNLKNTTVNAIKYNNNGNKNKTTAIENENKTSILVDQVNKKAFSSDDKLNDTLGSDIKLNQTSPITNNSLTADVKGKVNNSSLLANETKSISATNATKIMSNGTTSNESSSNSNINKTLNATSQVDNKNKTLLQNELKNSSMGGSKNSTLIPQNITVVNATSRESIAKVHQNMTKPPINSNSTTSSKKNVTELKPLLNPELKQEKIEQEIALVKNQTDNEELNGEENNEEDAKEGDPAPLSKESTSRKNATNAPSKEEIHDGLKKNATVNTNLKAPVLSNLKIHNVTSNSPKDSDDSLKNATVTNSTSQLVKNTNETNTNLHNETLAKSSASVVNDTKLEKETSQKNHSNVITTDSKPEHFQPLNKTVSRNSEPTNATSSSTHHKEREEEGRQGKVYNQTMIPDQNEGPMKILQPSLPSTLQNSVDDYKVNQEEHQMQSGERESSLHPIITTDPGSENYQSLNKTVFGSPDFSNATSTTHHTKEESTQPEDRTIGSSQNKDVMKHLQTLASSVLPNAVVENQINKEGNLMPSGERESLLQKAYPERSGGQLILGNQPEAGISRLITGVQQRRPVNASISLGGPTDNEDVVDDSPNSLSFSATRENLITPDEQNDLMMQGIQGAVSKINDKDIQEVNNKLKDLEFNEKASPDLLANVLKNSNNPEVQNILSGGRPFNRTQSFANETGFGGVADFSGNNDADSSMSRSRMVITPQMMMNSSDPEEDSVNGDARSRLPIKQTLKNAPGKQRDQVKEGEAALETIHESIEKLNHDYSDPFHTKDNQLSQTDKDRFNELNHVHSGNEHNHYLSDTSMNPPTVQHVNEINDLHHQEHGYVNDDAMTPPQHQYAPEEVHHEFVHHGELADALHHYENAGLEHNVYTDNTPLIGGNLNHLNNQADREANYRPIVGSPAFGHSTTLYESDHYVPARTSNGLDDQILGHHEHLGDETNLQHHTHHVVTVKNEAEKQKMVHGLVDVDKGNLITCD